MKSVKPDFYQWCVPELWRHIFVYITVNNLWCKRPKTDVYTWLDITSNSCDLWHDGSLCCSFNLALVMGLYDVMPPWKMQPLAGSQAQILHTLLSSWPAHSQFLSRRGKTCSTDTMRPLLLLASALIAGLLVSSAASPVPFPYHAFCRTIW